MAYRVTCKKCLQEYVDSNVLVPGKCGACGSTKILLKPIPDHVSVTFKYCDETKKWDPVVHGAKSRLEALQAFNAVVLSCKELDSDLLEFGQTEMVDSFNVRIHPAVAPARPFDGPGPHWG